MKREPRYPFRTRRWCSLHLRMHRPVVEVAPGQLRPSGAPDEQTIDTNDSPSPQETVFSPTTTRNPLSPCGPGGPAGPGSPFAPGGPGFCSQPTNTRLSSATVKITALMITSLLQSVIIDCLAQRGQHASSRLRLCFQAHCVTSCQTKPEAAKIAGPDTATKLLSADNMAHSFHFILAPPRLLLLNYARFYLNSQCASSSLVFRRVARGAGRRSLRETAPTTSVQLCPTIRWPFPSCRPSVK
jgi:hypothetical protein